MCGSKWIVNDSAAASSLQLLFVCIGVGEQMHLAMAMRPTEQKEYGRKGFIATHCSWFHCAHYAWPPGPGVNVDPYSSEVGSCSSVYLWPGGHYVGPRGC